MRRAAAIAAFLLAAVLHSHQAEPLPRAHAHNDYLHARPLLDALEQGFCSVEADIHLVNGELIVAHDLPKDASSLTKGRAKTLRKLYLEPLAERVRANGGSAFHGSNAYLLLLIDFKSEAEATYAALRKELTPFTEILTKFTDRDITTNAVTIVVSGNRPISQVAAERERYVAIDGRLPDLGTNPPAALVPLVSDNWTRFFQWRGAGPLAMDEKVRLREWVEKAHAQGRMIRFWAVPDIPEAWEALHSAGVDLINTDNLAGLADFLRAR